jgi:hypothetical protein
MGHADLHALLAAAVVASIHRDGEDVYLGLGRHDSRLWGLYRRGEEIASGPDPEELLRDYLRSVGEAER